jgi:excisionase family DNA binding protein
MSQNLFTYQQAKPKAKRGRKPVQKQSFIAPNEQAAPLWLSVSEAAKLAGVQSKTIRRAIEAVAINFKTVGNRYSINFSSLIAYLLKTTKLRNKFLKHGLGQYVDKWK